jgi:hypothetical protein
MLAIAVALLAGGVWLIRRGGRRAELARSA